jgi:hypothetical protein
MTKLYQTLHFCYQFFFVEAVLMPSEKVGKIRNPHIQFSVHTNILTLKHTAKMLIRKLYQTLCFCYWFLL